MNYTELQNKIDAGEQIACVSIKYISDGCHEQCIWLGAEEPQIGQTVFIASCIMPDYGIVEKIYKSTVSEEYENEDGCGLWTAEEADIILER